MSEPTAAGDRAEVAVADRPALVVRGMSKRFPGTRALADVDLEVARGEIHGLCGGNGSGKSTLIKILAGVYQGDAGGEIELGDVRAQPSEMTPAIAHRAGVRVVHQDLGVFPDMTVAENIALGHGFEQGLGHRIQWGKVRRRAEQLIERFEILATPATPVSRLSRAAQTQVAIARVLQDQEGHSGGILILDEPTTALPAHEVELLLSSLRRYAAAGQSILFVSHRLDDILSLTDRVTVLRDGSKVGTWQTPELTTDRLVELIVGRQIDRVFPEMPEVTDENPVLEVENLWAGPLRGVSLRVARGEVVGVAGLLGSGRTELLRAIFGDIPIERGEIRIDRRAANFSHPSAAIAADIAMVPENRAADAAFLDLPVYANMATTLLGRYWRGLRLRDREMRSDSTALMGQFGVKAPSSSALLNTLSGGNQQKVIMARWLRREPKLLLLDEPTQGVDVGARAEIYRLVRDAVANGASALIVASDFEELAHVSDRAIVLRNGRTVAEVTGPELAAERLIELSYAEGDGGNQ